MKKLMFVCCAVVASLISLNSYADLSAYAIDKRKVFSEFIFLPIIGSEKQGAFLYTRYKKSILSPASSSASSSATAIPVWRSVTLVLSPTAAGSPALNQFISTNGIVDNRKNLIPTDANLCVLSNDAKRKITDLGLLYSTNVLIGGYPKACSLIIRYYTAAQSDQEKALLNYLSTNNVISLSFSITEQLSPAVNVSFHDIVNELYSKNALVRDELSNYQGPLSAVTYHAAQLSPALFGETVSSVIPFSAWELFLNAFTLSGKTLKVQLTSSNEILSIPAIQEEIVNVNTTL